MFQTETSEDQDFQTPQVMKTIIIRSSMAHDNFENPFRVKGETVLIMQFRVLLLRRVFAYIV